MLDHLAAFAALLSLALTGCGRAPCQSCPKVGGYYYLTAQATSPSNSGSNTAGNTAGDQCAKVYFRGTATSFALTQTGSKLEGGGFTGTIWDDQTLTLSGTASDPQFGQISMAFSLGIFGSEGAYELKGSLSATTSQPSCILSTSATMKQQGVGF